MIVTTVDFFYNAETKKATRLRCLHSKWEFGVVFRQPRCLAAQLSHGGEDGGFCEAKLCPSERHAMDGVAGAQHQGWVVLQISCKALELNATRWIWFLYTGIALRDSA